jgi:hypothetical protein
LISSSVKSAVNKSFIIAGDTLGSPLSMSSPRRLIPWD